VEREGEIAARQTINLFRKEENKSDQQVGKEKGQRAMSKERNAQRP
jgi:hypothetical protein